MASDITNKLTDDLYQKTRSELGAFLDETNALLEAGDALSEDRTDQARQRLGEFLDRATSAVTEHDSLGEHGNAALVKAKAYVIAHPWQAVSVAAGVGLVASILLKRRQNY